MIDIKYTICISGIFVNSQVDAGNKRASGILGVGGDAAATYV